MENWKGSPGCGNCTSKWDDWSVSDSGGGRGWGQGTWVTETPKPAQVTRISFSRCRWLKILRKEVTGYNFGQAWPLRPPLHLLNSGVSVSEIMTLLSLLQYWVKWDHWPFWPSLCPTLPTHSHQESVLVSYCGLPAIVSPSPLSQTLPCSPPGRHPSRLVLGTGLWACGPLPLCSSQFCLFVCDAPGSALPTPAHFVL